MYSEVSTRLAPLPAHHDVDLLDRSVGSSIALRVLVIPLPTTMHVDTAIWGFAFGHLLSKSRLSTQSFAC